MNKKIILASQSPRRKQLLEWAEIDFEVLVVPTAEVFPPDLEIDKIPIHIASQKAAAVIAAYPGQTENACILAADTIVVLHERLIGKPGSRQEAIEILSALAGRQHQVITGVVLRHSKGIIQFSDTTKVWFHPLSLAQIEFYVDKYQPYDKAGAYAIQEWIGVTGIKSIEGDFYNVMGLPVSRVVQALKEINAESLV